jgi:hypothetical protein
MVSVDKFKDLFNSDSKQKTEVVHLTNDLSSAQAAAKKAAEAQAAADAANKAKQDLIHENVRAVSLALSKEKAPDLPVQVAAAFATKADNAFDALPASEAEEIAGIVDKLTAQDEADKASGAAQAAALQAKLDAATAQAVALQAQNAQASALAAKLQDQTVADSKSLAKWAADNATLLARLRSFVIWAAVFTGLFFLIFHFLPILAKFFPMLAPIAKGLSAVVAFPLHALHSAEAELAKLEAAAATAKATASAAALVTEQAAHASTTAALVKIAAPTK